MIFSILIACVHRLFLFIFSGLAMAYLLVSWNFISFVVPIIRSEFYVDVHFYHASFSFGCRILLLSSLFLVRI